MIKVEPICDSINPQGTRLITMKWIYPKFLHQESLRHRTLYIHDCLYDPDFSFSVSSARAIPFAKLLEEVRSDELRAAPLVWGAEQKGMSPGGEITDIQMAQDYWKDAALAAAQRAERLAEIGIHKSICNRIIEPYIHVNCLTTGTNRGWMNFFGLRLDQAADPTLQLLAQSAWKVWNESQPKLLQPGEWHLPYIDDETRIQCCSFIDNDKSLTHGLITTEIKVSAARCARLSYLSFSTNRRSTIEEDLELYNKLVGGNVLHASPMEHIATPDVFGFWTTNLFNKHGHPIQAWKNPEQSGNFELGWRQYRKMLPNESITPLPPGYLL